MAKPKRDGADVLVPWDALTPAQKRRFLPKAKLTAQWTGKKLKDLFVRVTQRFPKSLAGKTGIKIGEEAWTRYKTEARSLRSTGGRLYHHDAGDRGKGKKRTRAPALIVIPEENLQFFLNQPGGRRKWSSKLGLVG